MNQNQININNLEDIRKVRDYIENLHRKEIQDKMASVNNGLVTLRKRIDEVYKEDLRK